MEAGPTPEACEAPLSVDQFEHYIQEWSKQNKDRDAVHHVSDLAVPISVVLS